MVIVKANQNNTDNDGKIIVLTDNCMTLLQFLQNNDHVWIGKELNDTLNMPGIYSVIKSLIRNGLVQYCGDTVCEVPDKNGNICSRTYKTYSLTDAGRAWSFQQGRDGTRWDGTGRDE